MTRHCIAIVMSTLLTGPTICLWASTSPADAAETKPRPASRPGPGEGSQPAGLSTDVALRRLLQDADRHHQAMAFHLEAESLEKALALMAPGQPSRVATARRLVAVYRGGLWRFERAMFWVRTIADELGPRPEGIDPLFDLADALFNHGKTDEALGVYRAILKRIMAPDPPWDRNDNRCGKGWHGEELCKFPMGCEPLFPSDVAVSGKLGRLSQLVQNRDWRGIRSLLDQDVPLQSMMQRPNDPAVWVSLRRWVRETLETLPPETRQSLVAAYEPLFLKWDSQQGSATDATKDVWRTTAAFRLSHPLAALENRVDAIIGDRLLDLSMPGAAALYYGRLADQAGVDSPDLLARATFSRIQAGETVDPGALPDVAVQIAGEERSLRQWAGRWLSESPTTAPAATRSSLNLSDAVVSRLPMVRATLPLREWQFRWEARNTLEDEVPRFAEEFVSVIPAGPADCLLLNMGDAIQATDIVGGRTLWTFLPPEQNAMTFPSQKYEPRKAFIECARARTAVVVGDRVYCHLAWGHHDTYRHAGGLFALDRSDGRLVWSSLQLPQLADIMIAGDPAVSQGVVVALAWRPREALPLFFVVGLSAETGELLWLNHLFSGGSLRCYNNHFFLDHPLANSAPVIVDGIAYLCSAAGVVAAVDITDGTTLWATSYPRTKSLNTSPWAAHMATSRPAGMVAVFKDTVLFTPLDAHVLVAVDRLTGKTRYAQENLDLKAIAAADSERAFLAEGTAVRAVRPADGETLWLRTLPISGLVGLPTLGPRGLMCPSWEALYILDPAGGGIRESRPWKREEACSYLCDFGDRLAGVSRTSLHLLAGRKADETDPRWLSPEVGTKLFEAHVPSRADKWLRWGLPAVDRGDVVLSDTDPDHLMIRAEILQMRRIEPVPTLCWQRGSPLPWQSEVVFNSHYVAVWNLDDVYVLDAATGRDVWEDHPRQRMNRPIAGVRVVERQVQVYLGWHGGKELSQTAPTFIVFDDQGAREVSRNDPSLRAVAAEPAGSTPAKVQYQQQGRRIRAVNRQDGRQLWETATLLDEVRLVSEMGGWVVAVTQDRTFREGHQRGVSHLRVFDAKTGERIKDIAFPKRWFHRIEERHGRLLLWDCAFLYCVKAPSSDRPTNSQVVIRQEHPDPDAMASLRMARDLEDPPLLDIPRLAVCPRVDADLSEWSDVKPRLLSGVMDWSPDYARRSTVGARSYNGEEHCTADVRFAFHGDDLYIAVEVTDDRHCARPAPGLWRSDSVTLMSGEPKGEEIDPLFLTVALVNGVPRFELGTAVATFMASDPAGQELAAGPGPRRFPLPASSNGPFVLPEPTQSIELAARRDEHSRRTVYEIRAPKAVFRYGPDSFWDFFINDNDGSGRSGALQIASATWGTEETQTGSLRAVSGPPSPGQGKDSRAPKQRGGSKTRPAN